MILSISWASVCQRYKNSFSIKLLANLIPRGKITCRWKTSVSRDMWKCRNLDTYEGFWESHCRTLKIKVNCKFSETVLSVLIRYVSGNPSLSWDYMTSARLIQEVSNLFGLLFFPVLSIISDLALFVPYINSPSYFIYRT